MQERQKRFDYDIIPGRLVMSLSPSIELREIFGSASANAANSANYTGIADPVVDALIEEVIAAKTRDEMDARVRALDRVLRSKQILGAELDQARLLGRLLGRLRPARPAAALLARRRLLVVRPGQVRQAEGRRRASLRWAPTSSAA